MRKLPIFLGALVVIVAVVVLSLSPGKVYSANVGDQLSNPEAGWTRIETSNSSGPNSLFSFSSGWVYCTSAEPWSGGSTMYTGASNPSVSFSFFGTKLRVIGAHYPSRCSNITITIDGVQYSFSAYGSLQYATLLCDLSSLGTGSHNAVISEPSGYEMEIDAIDVESNTTTPSPTPVTTPTPAPAASPDLCYDYFIVGSLGTYNPGTIASNSQSAQAFTVTGTQLGDLVQVSFDQDLQGITLYGYVSAANQVTVVFQNRTGGNITLTSGNVRVHINRHVKG